MGPPLLLFGDGLSGTDARWTAAVNFAKPFSDFIKRIEIVTHGEGGPQIVALKVPILGLDTLSGSLATDLVLLRTRLTSFSKFFTVSGSNPYYWSDGSSYKQYPVCGPIFSMPSSPAQAAAVLFMAWQESVNYLRVTRNHYYGIGLNACGAGSPDVIATPPVYPLTSDGYVKTFNTLINVWQRGGPIAVSSYNILQQTEAEFPSRKGITRLTHPALVPYVQLQPI